MLGRCAASIRPRQRPNDPTESIGGARDRKMLLLQKSAHTSHQHLLPPRPKGWWKHVPLDLVGGAIQLSESHQTRLINERLETTQAFLKRLLQCNFGPLVAHHCSRETSVVRNEASRIRNRKHEWSRVRIFLPHTSKHKIRGRQAILQGSRKLTRGFGGFSSLRRGHGCWFGGDEK